MRSEGEIVEAGDGGGEQAQAVSAGTLAILTRAEIDVQISTAKTYPRSVKKFQTDALGLATLDEETAISCFYRLPRGGKTIEGPSIRLAEIIASAWGNLRYGTRIVGQDARFVTAEGVCHDLERNVSGTARIDRRITNRKGETFNDDMVAVTANAACAIAVRNAIFHVIPRAFWNHVYEQAKLTAIGKAETLTDRRASMVAYFQKMGVLLERLLAVAGKPSVEDLSLEDVFNLRAVANAIRTGETTVDQAFPEPRREEPKQSATEKLAEKLGGKKSGGGPPETKPASGETKPPNGEAKPAAGGTETPQAGTAPPLATKEQHDRINQLLIELEWARRNYLADYRLRRQDAALKLEAMSEATAAEEVGYLEGLLREQPAPAKE